MASCTGAKSYPSHFDLSTALWCVRSCTICWMFMHHGNRIRGNSSSCSSCVQPGTDRISRENLNERDSAENNQRLTGGWGWSVNPLLPPEHLQAGAPAWLISSGSQPQLVVHPSFWSLSQPLTLSPSPQISWACAIGLSSPSHLHAQWQQECIPARAPAQAQLYVSLWAGLRARWSMAALSES